MAASNRSLASLLPVFFESFAFLLDVRLGSYAQLDGCGFCHGEDGLPAIDRSRVYCARAASSRRRIVFRGAAAAGSARLSCSAAAGRYARRMVT